MQGSLAGVSLCQQAECLMQAWVLVGLQTAGTGSVEQQLQVMEDCVKFLHDAGGVDDVWNIVHG